ncbi:MAG TPA: hypothetical protein VJ747_16790 [Stellaceae bacterium]|nr:hypothetical protein [Stellaceae bacterium]
MEKTTAALSLIADEQVVLVAVAVSRCARRVALLPHLAKRPVDRRVGALAVARQEIVGARR